jgi:hypothetical protein
MTTLTFERVLPTILLILFMFVTSIGQGAYAGLGIEPPGYFTLISHFGLLSLIGFWFIVDSRKHRVNWILDMGVCVYLAWPIVLPYYLFKTRGMKAFLTLFAFFAIYLTANIAAGFAYFIFSQAIE